MITMTVISNKIQPLDPVHAFVNTYNPARLVEQNPRRILDLELTVFVHAGQVAQLRKKMFFCRLMRPSNQWSRIIILTIFTSII